MKYDKYKKFDTFLDKSFFMIDNWNMKSLLCLVMFALSVFSPNSTAFVIATKCPLLSEADFTSEIVQYEDTDFYLTQNQQVEIISSEENFVYVKVNENVEGYVYKYYLSQNSSQTVYPVFNCSVRENCLVYDLEKSPTTYVAKKDERVFIFNGFDKVEGGYTEVQIVLEDGTLYSGLIKSQSLKPDGVNRTAIIAIPVIMAGITVILSIVFIGKKKKKKNVAV